MASKSTILLSIAIAVCFFSCQGEGANNKKQHHPVAPAAHFPQFPQPLPQPLPQPQPQPQPLPQPIPQPLPDTCPVCDKLTGGFDANKLTFVDLITELTNAIEKVEECTNPVSSQVMTVVSSAKTGANRVTNARCPVNYIVADCRCSREIDACSGVWVDQNGRRCRSRKLGTTPVAIRTIATCVPKAGKIVVKNSVRGMDPTSTCDAAERIVGCLLENRSGTPTITHNIDLVTKECSVSASCGTGSSRCRVTAICETV